MGLTLSFVAATTLAGGTTPTPISTALAVSAPGSSSSTPSPVGPAVGGAIGGFTLLLLIFSYRAYTRRNAVPIASDARADGGSTAAAKGQFPAGRRARSAR